MVSRSATFPGDETRWLHTAPLCLPKQAKACWDEAPHRGALHAYPSSGCTGRPEIAAQPPTSSLGRLKMFNDGLRLTATPGGTTRPADPSASFRFNGCLVDYRATASSDWPGKLPPADGAGAQTPTLLARQGRSPDREAPLGAGGRGVTRRRMYV